MAENRALLDRLRERTTARVQNARHAPSYNVPMAWYCRPDGDIVRLQGDSWNRAYYEDKGFAFLRPDEVKEWERDIRPSIVAQQKRRATLINTIRRLAAKNQTMQAMVDDAVKDDTEMEELESILTEIGKATNTPVGIYLKRAEQALSEREEPDPDARGIEVIPGAEEIQKKIERGATRGAQNPLIQGTGYDPTTGRAVQIRKISPEEAR